jgi:hypothetical protein
MKITHPSHGFELTLSYKSPLKAAATATATTTTIIIIMLPNPV